MGRVVAPDGVPIAGARLRLGGVRGGRKEPSSPDRTRRSWAPVRLRTNPQGRFARKGLPVGSATLWAWASDRAPIHRTVSLLPGQETRVVLEMPLGTRVTGRVLDPRGVSLAGASVRVEGRDRDDERATLTGPDGRFELSALPNEELGLVATARGYGEARQLLSGAPVLTLTWNPRLKPLPQVTGIVRSPSHQPLAGWEVMLEGGPGLAVTDLQGRFALSLSRGRGAAWLVLAPPQSRARLICKWLGLVGPDSSEVEVEVPAEFLPSAFVHGILLDGAGAPVERGALRVSRDGRVAKRVSLIRGSGGAFRIGPLVPGSVTLHLLPQNPTEVIRRVATVTLATGQKLDLGEIRLTRPGRLVVQIGRSDGVPLQNAAAFLTTSAGQGMMPALCMDAAGRGTLALPQGVYTLSVLADNAREAAPLNLEIRAGADTLLTATLLPAVRRHVAFPVPAPPGWSDVKKASFRILDPAGHTLEQGEWNPQNDWIYRTMPSFGIGLQHIEIRCASGRRFTGSFEIRSLTPSNALIPVRVQ